jgi:hypothetical protein
MLEGESVNPRKRARSPSWSPPSAAVEQQKDEWPDFKLERKHHRNVDIRWGMHLYPDYLDSRSMVEVAGSTSAFADEHIPDKDVARCFGQRILYRITDSGTSANLIAIRLWVVALWGR